ncbi:MAG: FKBP-type peptidyl-prolyl cis-trans isomerase [Candidatus Saccharimonadales bacterium]
MKRAVLISSFTALVLVTGGGLAYSQTHKSTPNSRQLAARGDAARLAELDNSNNATSTGSVTPLGGGTQDTNDSQAGSGLQATGSSSTASLGQLGQKNSGQQGTGQSSQNSSQSNPFDPTTFSQYEKYHDDQSALSGDVQAGTGDALEAGKTATVYYRGWLSNGTMFDQSRTDSSGKMQPFTFTLGNHQVIPGWEQGLAGMKVGGVRLLIVPPTVGYGASGQGSIPPNSLLIFQVQLVDVK